MEQHYAPLPNGLGEQGGSPVSSNSRIHVEPDESPSATLGVIRSSRNASPTSHPTTQDLVPRNPVPMGQISTNWADSRATHLRRANILKNWWIEIGACCIF